MINLKSDLMNLPTLSMWKSMERTKPGWVIDRIDPTVNELEQTTADMLGKERGLFVITGRMACLVALMTLCERGDQIIMEEDSHIAWAQEWGLSYICGLYPRLIKGCNGVMDGEKIKKAIYSSRFKHRPETGLLCLENTHNMSGGSVMTPEQTHKQAQIAHDFGAKVFLDGARLLYAAAALDVEPIELAQPADMVSISLIKGIGALGGAVLCGRETDIDKAFRNMQRLGGHAFHRAGIIAASGLIALRDMPGKLKEDIRRAIEFARMLKKIDTLDIDLSNIQSNIVMVGIEKTALSSDQFLEKLKECGLLGHQFTEKIVRFTFHQGITDREVNRSYDIIKNLILKINA